MRGEGQTWQDARGMNNSGDSRSSKKVAPLMKPPTNGMRSVKKGSSGSTVAKVEMGHENRHGVIG